MVARTLTAPQKTAGRSRTGPVPQLFPGLYSSYEQSSHQGWKLSTVCALTHLVCTCTLLWESKWFPSCALSQESVCMPRNACAGAWQSHIPQVSTGYTRLPVSQLCSGCISGCIPVLELLPPSGRFSNVQFTDRALQQLGNSSLVGGSWGCSACKPHSAETSTPGSRRELVCYRVK